MKKNKKENRNKKGNKTILFEFNGNWLQLRGNGKITGEGGRIQAPGGLLFHSIFPLPPPPSLVRASNWDFIS